MATASIPGFKADVYVAASSDGTTPVRVGEIKDFTLTIAEGAMEATSKDSAGWREFLPGLREWSGSGSGLYLLDSTNAGQVSTYECLRQGNLIGLTLYEASSVFITGGQVFSKYTGNAVVTGFDIEAPLDGPAGIKIALKGTAALTKAAATS